MRELTNQEEDIAALLCALRHRGGVTFHESADTCPSCRAAVVALVDEGVQPPAPPIIRAPAEMRELKPCPFCGAEPFLLGPNFAKTEYVQCSTEGCIGDAAQIRVDVWNRRAPAEAVHPDSALLDWLADEPIFDGLGDMDIHETACNLAGGVEVSPEKMRECYRKAIRVLINNAMAFDASRQGKETSDG